MDGHTIKEAIKIAEQKNVAIPRSISVYMDDSFGILRQNSTNTTHEEFAACLSEVDPRLKFTFEMEDNGKIAFLDALIIKNQDGRRGHESTSK